ncbi:EamA family transporter [Marinomonas arctica]|uniref:EamA family transporter n=2 Tax=Oceanospirillaceae TaxID=135620 RepID=A0A7H1JBZ1_9GAMM|nr:EamA family transporter [Marinomonas arctica]MCS7486655.1 membrane protein [Marinomonas sp. BSi20414]QNT08007.1 EamA family transporter [Marinomonas arctica]GGN22868.1 membrane protein [Marinomonas arctica]
MKLRDFGLLFALMALWGLNFSVIKLGVSSVHPLILTALRFSFAVFPLIFFIKKPDVPWRYLIAYGLSFGVGVWGLTTLSIGAGVSAGMASLLLDMSVVSSLLVGWLCLNETMTRNKLLGAGLALLGLILIMYSEGGSVTGKGLVLVLMASVFWSINGLIVKRANTKSIFAFNIWGMVFAPLPLLLLAVMLEGTQVITELPNQLTQWTLFSALFQAYPTTLLGYWFWNKMIMKYSVSSVAPMTLLVPVFGILGGYWFYDEAIQTSQIIAAVLILLGLFVGQMALPRFLSVKQYKGV